MAGHSKWANIKHRKARSDARKGKVFSRCAKEIISAVRQGGADPKGNTRLRIAIDKARMSNVPNDVVERNIKKASAADQADYHELTYELYGHGGVGIIVDIMTDNKNRIASDIRIATNKRGGVVANPGAVAYNFERKGVIQIPVADTVEDEVFEAVTEAGAEGFEKVDELYVVTTDPTDLMTVKDAIEKRGFTVTEAILDMLPKVWVECDAENAKANSDLIQWIEEIDDVDNVYHNMQVPEGSES